MTLNVTQIKSFLTQVDHTFPTPLSQKQQLSTFAVKLYEKATLCTEVVNNKIIAMVAGYTEEVIDNKAYISIVATLPEAKGNGLASKLVKEFISICKKKNLDAVHLYAVPTNRAAMHVYYKLGFIDWKLPDEPRPEDAHLIYYIKKRGNHR